MYGEVAPDSARAALWRSGTVRSTVRGAGLSTTAHFCLGMRHMNTKGASPWLLNWCMSSAGM